MTVEELIKALKNIPPNYTVCIPSDEGISELVCWDKNDDFGDLLPIEMEPETL